MLQIALCILVFFFAFHAKTAVYRNGSVTRLAPATSSKLWLKAQERKVETPVLPNLTLLFCVLLFLQQLLPQRLSSVHMLALPPLGKLGYPGGGDPGLFFRPPPLR